MSEPTYAPAKPPIAEGMIRPMSPNPSNEKTYAKEYTLLITVALRHFKQKLADRNKDGVIRRARREIARRYDLIRPMETGAIEEK